MLINKILSLYIVPLYRTCNLCIAVFELLYSHPHFDFKEILRVELYFYGFPALFGGLASFIFEMGILVVTFSHSADVALKLIQYIPHIIFLVTVHFL